MLSLLGFGKRRRRSTKSRKSAKKGGRKPPAALLKMCKKYRVKTTVKRGTKRVYKKARLLKKLCMRKKKMMLKKKKSTKSRKVRRTRRVRRSRFGGALSDIESKRPMLLFGAASGCGLNKKPGMMGFGKKRAPKMNTRMAMKQFDEFYKRHCSHHLRKTRFGNLISDSVASKKFRKPTVTEFGKKRYPKINKPLAMRQFKDFYKRHCHASSRMGGRFRFGSGGNPALSGGYEFCPSGQGGVLGANSTGLFPSPCTPYDAAQAAAEANVPLPTYAPGPTAAAFGRRYGGRRKCYGRGKSRYCLRLKPKRKNLYYL
jgi:hypothetical protein